MRAGRRWGQNSGEWGTRRERCGPRLRGRGAWGHNGPLSGLLRLLGAVQGPWGTLSKHTPCSGCTQCPGTGSCGTGPAERAAAGPGTRHRHSHPCRGHESPTSAPPGSLRFGLNPRPGTGVSEAPLDPAEASLRMAVSARLPGPATLTPRSDGPQGLADAGLGSPGRLVCALDAGAGSALWAGGVAGGPAQA